MSFSDSCAEPISAASMTVGLEMSCNGLPAKPGNVNFLLFGRHENFARQSLAVLGPSAPLPETRRQVPYLDYIAGHLSFRAGCL